MGFVRKRGNIDMKIINKTKNEVEIFYYGRKRVLSPGQDTTLPYERLYGTITVKSKDGEVDIERLFDRRRIIPNNLSASEHLWEVTILECEKPDDYL